MGSEITHGWLRTQKKLEKRWSLFCRTPKLTHDHRTNDSRFTRKLRRGGHWCPASCCAPFARLRMAMGEMRRLRDNVERDEPWHSQSVPSGLPEPLRSRRRYSRMENPTSRLAERSKREPAEIRVRDSHARSWAQQSVKYQRLQSFLWWPKTTSLR